jgi:hypothetical protein
MAGPTVSLLRDEDITTLEDHLAEVETLVGQLLARLPNDGAGQSSTRSASRSFPLPYRDDIAQARIQLEGVLVGWARIVSEEQAIALPKPDLIAVAQYLGRHLPWLLDQPFIDELFNEVDAAINGCRKALADREPTLTIGTCPGTLTDGRPCTGVLMVTPIDRVITCKLCATAWEADTWPRLGLLLGCDPVGLVDAYVASARLHDLGYTITPATIRKWVQRGKVSAKGKGQRQRHLYDLADLLELARVGA